MPDFWQQVRDIAAEAAKAEVEKALAAREAAQVGAGVTQPPEGGAGGPAGPAGSGGSVYVAAIGKSIPGPISGEDMQTYARRAADALAGGDGAIAQFYRNAAGMLSDAAAWGYGADQRSWPDVLGRWSKMLVADRPVDVSRGLHSRIDEEPPRGTPGSTWIESLGVNLPNAVQDEGPAGYVERVSRIMARGDAAKAWQIANSTGPLAAGQASSYGFTADRASFPEAAARFGAVMMATPGQGTVATGDVNAPRSQDVSIG